MPHDFYAWITIRAGRVGALSVLVVSLAVGRMIRIADSREPRAPGRAELARVQLRPAPRRPLLRRRQLSRPVGQVSHLVRSRRGDVEHEAAHVVAVR